ncbi:hypothetical protein C0993_005863 [Termitomyces sp. T159_Od127]|nr:hypothetical protein C0993_005863 [Termitomyces sp. T159_Od127]
MPIWDHHPLEDCHPRDGLRDCPWGTTADHLLAAGPLMVDPPVDGAQQRTPFPHTPLLYNPNPQDDIHDALTCKGKLDIQKLEPFHCHDSCKWRTFLTQCLTMFQAKPLTFQLESSCVAFATSYLQGIAFDHYTVLLQVDPNSLVLSNWQAFAQEFSSKFGVFDTVVEAKENLFNLQMCNDKRGWNYNTL